MASFKIVDETCGFVAGTNETVSESNSLLKGLSIVSSYSFFGASEKCVETIA